MTPDVTELRAQLRALQNTWEYAFAMGAGCTTEDSSLRSAAVRQRAADLTAQIQEHTA